MIPMLEREILTNPKYKDKLFVKVKIRWETRQQVPSLA